MEPLPPWLDSPHMEVFWGLVLWASRNCSGTPAPTTGLTLMSAIKWLFQGSVLSNPTTLLPPHHPEPERLSQTALVEPSSLCPWPWFPYSFFQRKPGAFFSWPSPGEARPGGGVSGVRTPSLKTVTSACEHSSRARRRAESFRHITSFNL